MIDEYALADALNRWEFYDITLKELCKILQEISARDLMWTYHAPSRHKTSFHKFRVTRINNGPS